MHTLLSLLHSRDTEDLKDNCMSSRGLWRAESQDCYPLYGRVKNNFAFHSDVTMRKDGTQFPCKGVLAKGIDILNQRLQVYCWVVFFCCLPRQLKEVRVHIYMQHCLHSRTTPAWEALLGCQGWEATTSRSNDPGYMVIQRRWSGLQLSQMISKMQESKAKTRSLSLPGGR